MKKYTSVSKYPSSDIDLAFEVPDDTSSASVAGCLRKAGGTYLKEVQLFDSYKADGANEGVRRALHIVCASNWTKEHLQMLKSVNCDLPVSVK